MAISSPLNPTTITGPSRKVSPEQTANFLTGGSPLGQGVLANAANKIVGFTRGAAAVSPQVPDISSIIQTLSTNILNNVNNQVQSINQNISNIVNPALSDLQSQYKDKMESVDDSKPSKLLQNFLSLYKDALGYVQFLGNRKNIQNINSNLVALQRIFVETFDVARLIRKVINKIVKQLSNLPKAGGGAGGLSLDVKVPGGPLKRSGAKSGISRNMRRFGKFGLAAGVGAGGAMAVNALSSPTGADQISTPVGEQQLSGLILDKFNSVLDRFSAAISALGNVKSSPAMASSGGGSGAPASGDDEGGKKGGGGSLGTGSSNIEPGSEEEARIAAALVTEGAGGTAATDILQVAANRMATGKYKDYTDVFAAEGQFAGVFDNPRGGVEGYKKIKTVADAAAWAGVSEEVIKSRISDMRNPELRADSAKFVKGAQQFRAAPSYYLKKGLVKGEMGADGRFYNSSWRGGSGDNQFFTTPGDMGAGTEAAPINYDGSKLVAAAKPAEPEKPTVTPAQTSQEVQQEIAQKISRPARRSATGGAGVSVAPPVTAGGGSQKQPVPTSSGGYSPPRGEKMDNVPFYTSSDGNNFLSLHSKLTYNIVEG